MKLGAWRVILSQALLLGVPLFAAAGTLQWRAAWTFLILVIAASTLTNLMLAARDPELLEERNKPLVRRDQSPWDRLLLPTLVVLSVGWLVVMGLDARRFHWSRMPSWLQLVGVLGIAAGMWIRYRSLQENTFLSTVMKIQKDRNHTVISTGPYARVRHPLYAGVLLLFPSTALLLESWIGLTVAILPSLGLIVRTAMEDRELRLRLDGYLEYAGRVRHRLIPLIW